MFNEIFLYKHGSYGNLSAKNKYLIKYRYISTIRSLKLDLQEKPPSGSHEDVTVEY